MSLKHRIAVFAALALICLMMTACVQTVASPKDEIRLYDWAGEYENGNAVSLHFSDRNADFCAVNKDFTVDISGVYSVTDDSLVIFDDDKGVGYEFAYQLHGDSLELSYHGDSIVLEKKVEE